MIEIVLESFNSLFKSFDLFLQTKDLTLGAIFAGLAPFVVIWIKLSKEKEKKARSLLIERRQMQIAFNINEIMAALKVESKWSIAEIGSTNEDQQSSKKSRLLLQAVTILRRTKTMGKLKSRKFWLTILAALIPVINKEFDINLDITSVAFIMSAIMGGVAALAHVDAKKVIANAVNVITHPSKIEFPNVTYSEILPAIQAVHNAFPNLLRDARLNDGSQAYKDAAQAYLAIKPIIDSLKQPEPLPIVADEQVSA